MKVNHQSFKVSPQAIIEQEDLKFYTTKNHSEFQDAQGFYRTKEDNDTVFAKAIRDKLSKNITNQTRYYSYYIKASPNRILHDARNLYVAEKSEENHSYINSVCKSGQDFIQVSEAVFIKYLNFLQTENTQWLNQAQREVK
jgi:hypothetical protein